MKCTNCGADLPQGSTVCFECGAPQQTTPTNSENSTPAQPYANQANTPNQPYAPNQFNNAPQGNRCRTCGAVLPDGATVCFQCGAPQNVVNNGPAYNQAPNGVPMPGAHKSKVGAALLAFFFGAYGVDQFYLGYVKTGVIRLVVSAVTCGTGGVIWGIVDCVRIATGSIAVDAKGNPII